MEAMPYIGIITIILLCLFFLVFERGRSLSEGLESLWFFCEVMAGFSWRGFSSCEIQEFMWERKHKPSILMTLNKMWMRRGEMVPNKRMPSAMGSCAPWLALSTTTH